MLKWFLHIGYVCVMLVGLVACRSNDDVLPQKHQEDVVEVGMTLVMDRNLETRTVTEEPGTAAENYIDIVNEDFRFYLFREEDNTFLSEINVKSIQPISSNHYYVRAQMKKVTEDGFKVVVVANWRANGTEYPTLKENETIHDLCESSEYAYSITDYSTNPFKPMEREKSIPMYGVHTYENVTLETNIETMLEDIYLVRAMAKVEVICEAEGYELVSATMTNFSARGMATPINVYENTEDIKDKWSNAMHVDHEDVVNGHTIPFLKDNNEKSTIYVPEYRNKHEELLKGVYEPSYITVWLKKSGENDDQAKEYPIAFVNYVDGKPSTDEKDILDIWRNNCYRFVITKVGAGIELKYQVAKWIEKDENKWVQNFEYPTFYQVRPWYKKDEPSLNIEEKDATMYYDASLWKTETVDGEEKKVLNIEENEYVNNIGNLEKGAFDVSFKLTAPSNHEWEPAIHGSDEEYTFVVYRLEGDKFVYVKKPYTASEHWYRILILPKNENAAEIPVEFGISTKITHTGETVFLLINGQDVHTTRWPGSPDARIIKVTQVEPTTDEDTDEGGN